MANSGYTVGVYSGRTSNDAILNVWRHEVSGNSTRWAWSLTARKFGATSYVLDSFAGSVTVAGETWGFSHNLDFRNTSSIVLASGVTGWKGHDGAGNYNVGFSFSHGPASIFGTAAGSSSFAADQLPTVPYAPAPLGCDQITSTSFRYRFSNTGGGAATYWEFQVATRADFVGAEMFSSGGTTTVTGRTPGASYWLRSRGGNAFGVGAWSAVSTVTLPLAAPELLSWAQTPDGAMVASWGAPAPATGLSGYRLQVARDAGFTTGVQLIDLAAGTTSYSVAGGVGGRTYHARVAARTDAAGLGDYSAARQLVLVLDAGDLDGWQRITPKPAGLAYFTAEGIRRGTIDGRSALVLETVATGAATIAADATGIQRTVAGLTAGKAYRFTAGAQLLAGTTPAIDSYRLRVVSESSAAAVTVTQLGVGLGYIEFVADAASVTLQILAAEPATVAAAADEIERVAFYGVKLLQLATDYPVRLRETVYESSLANHFDLACNSVGASWYVGKDGVTQFRLPGAALPVSATFTDEPAAGALHYVEPAVSYDTRGMVNRLDVTNYGVDETRQAEQNDELVVTSQASIDAYGVRSARLETNLYGLAPYDESLNARLAELLAGAAEPRLFVSAVRWNAQEDLAAANALDVGQRVLVRFNGTEQDSQIVALQHEITPRRWIVTATLRRL
ncbi:minor tail protein [Microbacterium phage BonaeVitae]|uniref:Minor tail protein n=1 Tax=Microbacterium phage BonaeVitae TaxID=2126925 RepID=A0A2R3ZZJ5_9CAUD|nr:minor tail protein [Microbacterium phage BonaeVitae]AVR56164.1 minor tail protein [Microbacterium phage BonaeVitae]